MPKRVQFRRGNTAQHSVFTGGQGEVTYNSETKRLTSHDGSTAGGHPHALLSEALQKANNFADIEDAAESRDNLGVFSKSDSYGLANGRAASPRIFFDGVTDDQRAVCALPFTIGDREFSVRIAFRYPSSSGIARTLFYIGTADDAPSANGFSVHFTATGELEVRLYGASVSDYTYQQTTEQFAAYAGKVVELHVVRNFLGISLFLNGAAVSTGSVTAFGTAPGFTATISAAYLVLGDGIASTSPFLGDVLALTLLDYALTAAQALSLFREGLSAYDQWTTFEGGYSFDFSAPSSWANVDMSAYDESGDLSLVATAAGQKTTLPDSAFGGGLPQAKRHQIRCLVSNLVGGPFAFYSSEGQLLGTISANGNFSCTFVVEDSFGDLEIRAVAAGSVDIDDLHIDLAGSPLDLSFGEASLRFIPGRVGTGIDAVHPGYPPQLLSAPRSRFLIRGSTATSGNEQLLGGACIDAACRISEIVILVGDDGTPVTTISIGSTSGGSDIASGVSVSALDWNEITLAGRYSPTGEIWISSNGTSTLHVRILADDLS